MLEHMERQLMTDDTQATHTTPLRPSAKYFLRYANGNSDDFPTDPLDPDDEATYQYTAADMDDAPPGSTRDSYLTWLYRREQTERWLRKNAQAYGTPVDDTPTYEEMHAKHDLYQASLAKQLGEAVQPGQVIISSDTTMWWWKLYGLLQWGGTFYLPNDPTRVPDYVLDQVAYWYLIPPPYPDKDDGSPENLGKRQGRSPYHTIIGHGPVTDGMEGVYRFAEQLDVVRSPSKPPYVKTHNGNIVSVGALVGTVLDAREEEDAFQVGQQLSDATVLAFVLGLERWTTRGDRRDPRSYAVVTVNEYCDARGWARHHKGSHFPKNKAQARQEMMGINKVFVRHKVPEHLVTSDGTRYVEGQLMAVSVGTRDKAGIHPVSFRMSPGTWADDYLKFNPNATALLLERILSINTSGRVGQIAFRLGLYLALNWRTKYMNNNPDQPHAVHSLLEAIGIDPKAITRRDERSRVRSYLITALDLLQSPDIAAIGQRDETGALVDDWHYANASAGDPDTPAAWKDWLGWTLHLPAPYEIGTFYEGPRIARQAAIKEGIAKGKRRERAINAAKAKQALKKDSGEA